MLLLQPAMGDASAGDVAAALGAGTRMHKAWVHAAGKPVRGSHRTVACRVAGGRALITYQRGLLRGRRTSPIQRSSLRTAAPCVPQRAYALALRATDVCHIPDPLVVLR